METEDAIRVVEVKLRRGEALTVTESQLAAYGAIPAPPGPPEGFIGPREATRATWTVQWDGNRFQHVLEALYCTMCAGTGRIQQEAFYAARAGWRSDGAGDAGDLVLPARAWDCESCLRRDRRAKQRSAAEEAYLDALQPRCGKCLQASFCPGCGRRACHCEAACICVDGEAQRCPCCTAPIRSPKDFDKREHRSTCVYAYHRTCGPLIELAIGAGVLDVFGAQFTPDFMRGLLGSPYKEETWVWYAVRIGLMPYWPAQGAKLVKKPHWHLVPNPEPKEKKEKPAA